MTTNGYIVTDEDGELILGWGITPSAADADATGPSMDTIGSYLGEVRRNAQLPHYPSSYGLAAAYVFGAAGGHTPFVVRDDIAMTTEEDGR